MSDTDRTQSDHTTTTTTTNSGSGSGMAFIVGALVIVVAGLAYFLFSGGDVGSNASDVNITVEGAGDAAQGAADAVKKTVTPSE